MNLFLHLQKYLLWRAHPLRVYQPDADISKKKIKTLDFVLFELEFDGPVKVISRWSDCMNVWLIWAFQSAKCLLLSLMIVLFYA